VVLTESFISTESNDYKNKPVEIQAKKAAVELHGSVNALKCPWE